MVLGIEVDLSALPYFLHLFPGPYRAGIPGRLVPVSSDRASRRRAVSRGLTHPRSETQVGVRRSALARPFGRRGRLKVGWRPKRALWSKRWPESEKRLSFSLARPSDRRLDCPSGLLFTYLGWPMSCTFVCLSRAFVGKSVSEGPQVYEPNKKNVPKQSRHVLI